MRNSLDEILMCDNGEIIDRLDTEGFSKLDTNKNFSIRENETLLNKNFSNRENET